MNKVFGSIILSIVMLFAFTANADAVTTVRLEKPQTPTNKNTFDLTFVTLDTVLTSTITGQCYKKGPSDTDYTAFGSGFSFANGGNSGKCAVTSSIMNESGPYSFMVKATGSSSTTSNVISVDFNTSTSPGTPTNYSKQKTDNCTYKISFKSANDDNKTVKVVLYRSEDNKFNLDSGTQANQVNIGSNTDGSMTSFSSSNCDKERFFALRAFDVYGNGSGTIGDKNIETTVTGETTTTAAPVIVAETVVTDENTIGVNEERGVVEGENQVNENATEDVLGEKTNSITEKIKNTANSIFSFGILAAISDFFTKIFDFIKSLFN